MPRQQALFHPAMRFFGWEPEVRKVFVGETVPDTRRLTRFGDDDALERAAVWLEELHPPPGPRAGQEVMSGLMQAQKGLLVFVDGLVKVDRAVATIEQAENLVDGTPDRFGDFPVEPGEKAWVEGDVSCDLQACGLNQIGHGSREPPIRTRSPKEPLSVAADICKVRRGQAAVVSFHFFAFRDRRNAKYSRSASSS
jgi:hypothetical protein